MTKRAFDKIAEGLTELRDIVSGDAEAADARQAPEGIAGAKNQFPHSTDAQIAAKPHPDRKSATEAADAPFGGGGCPEVPETGFTPSGDAQSAFKPHSDRTVDPERAGGTGDAAPKRTLGAAPMTLEEARQYHEQLLWWRAVPTKAGRALDAYEGEVERLHRKVEALLTELVELRQRKVDALLTELTENERRDLVEVLDAAIGEVQRRRMVNAGIIPASDQPREEPPDGA